MEKRSELLEFISYLFEWISKVFSINIHWLLFNMPLIITVLYTLVSGIDMIMIFIVFILSIILFFPTTTAMYASVRECILYRGQQISFKRFTSFFIENYVRSIGIGGIMVPLWTIWSISMFLFLKESNLLFLSFLYF